MQVKFIEAHDATRFNWGKFMLGRWTEEEWAYQSKVASDSIHGQSLIGGRGWCRDHILVLDLQTGEGAVFLPGGSPKVDLNGKHRIWV